MDDEKDLISIDLGDYTSTGYDSTYDVTSTMSGIDTITLTGTGYASTTVPMYASTIVGGGGGGPYTISTSSGTNGTYLYSNNTWHTPSITSTSGTSGISVKGDADFDGDVKLKGKSLCDWMATMEKRLAILVPDPKKLEKFEALQKAYNHYKMLEALCEIEDEQSEK